MLEKIVFALSKNIATSVSADSLGDLIGDIESTAKSATTVEELVQSVVNISIPLGVLAAVGLLTIAGYNMITSQGNPEKIGEAREIVTNAIIGFGMIVLATAILLLIKNVLELPTT